VAIKAERDERFSPKPPVVSLQEERGIPALPVCLMKFRSLTGRSNALSLRGQEAFPRQEFLTLEQQQQRQQHARKRRRRPVRSRTRGERQGPWTTAVMDARRTSSAENSRYRLKLLNPGSKYRFLSYPRRKRSRSG
ncbi:hypothetical protein ALC57_00895, partial [Trachymyrmex cornetzi]